MPFTSYDSFKTCITSMAEVSPYLYCGFERTGNIQYLDPLAFTSTGSVPTGISIPTSPVVCTKETTGSMNKEFPNKSPLTQYIVKANLGQGRLDALSSFDNCFILLADRLTHQGGLVTNVGTVQTTNLPTAALTRYTDGIGVLAGITHYVQTSSSCTITVSYTNQAGVSGRISTSISMATNRNNFYIVPMQQGDSGIRSIQNITIGTTTTSAGNIGVSLFKPLAMFGTSSFISSSLADYDFISGNMLGGIPIVLDDACLIPIIGNRIEGSLSLNGMVSGELYIGAN